MFLDEFLATEQEPPTSMGDFRDMLLPECASAPVKLTGSTFFGPDFNPEVFKRKLKLLDLIIYRMIEE
jgi:hypothetical protein